MAPMGMHGQLVFRVEPHLLTWTDSEGVLTFDGEGRLYAFAVSNALFRRGMDSRVLETRREPADGYLRRSHRYLGEKEAFELFRRVHRLAGQMTTRVARGEVGPTMPGEQQPDSQARGLVSRLEEVVSWSPERLVSERSRFQQFYKPISVLPPDRYMSLVVQIAHGCPYNQCTFCDLYSDRTFEILSPHDVRTRVAGIRSFFGRALPLRQGVFLGDGNALSLPAHRLVASLAIIREELPPFLFVRKGVSTFGDLRAVLHKSDEELVSLGSAGLDRVYLGLESGAESLLRFLNKPARRTDQVEAVVRLKGAGIQAGIIFMSGVGGQKFAEEHVRETSSLVNDLPLGVGDLVYVSRFYPIRGTPYADRVKSGEIDVMGDEEIRNQVGEIRRRIRPEILKTVKLAPYDLAGFVY